jgi:2',3'-cyclic-nucleotide 2'-phosphodiesterase (5'-nucleotidase family)
LTWRAFKRITKRSIMFKSTRFVIPAVALLFWAMPSHATLIQILHTNDLHASLQTAGAPASGQEYGGWAQLKSVMDKLTADAKAQGIETVKLDAGDYTEGTSYYFPDHGRGVIRAFQHMGYDASAMGNHDWLMGADEMDDLYESVPFPFPILSANTKFSNALPNLKKQIVPSTQIVRGGIKIGVFGLSTDEALYSWIPRVASGKSDMKLLDYRDQLTVEVGDNGEAGSRMEPGIANQMVEKLRKENDVVIALTHIGYEEDKLLAASSHGLDLIVGGHSHTFLPTAVNIAGTDGKNVPIVQTGFNGQCVGKIILDVEPGKRPVLVSYELVPVYHQGDQDPTIAAYVKNAQVQTGTQFGTRLDEVIGTSEDRLVSGNGGPTSFSQFAVDSMEDISKADFALDVGAFHGNTPQPAGPVTRRNLMEMYPRKFEYDQNEGLYVYEADVPGILIKIGLQYITKYGMYVSFSGVTYDLNRMTDKDFAKARMKVAGTPDADLMTPYFPSNIKINGEPVKAFSWYTLAGPESLVRGAMALSPLMAIVIHRPHPTTHTIWDAMNFHLLKTGKVTKMDSPTGPSPWTPEIHTPRTLFNDLVIQTSQAVQTSTDPTGIK